MSHLSEIPTDRERHISVMAATLYLVNLLLVPILSFIVLLWLNSRADTRESEFASHHARQNLVGSVIAGCLIVIFPVAVLLVSRTMIAWTVALLWLISWHATMVLLGVLSLSRAMNGERFVYPVFGRLIDKR